MTLHVSQPLGQEPLAVGVTVYVDIPDDAYVIV
jgi:hypothetical protein